MHNVRNHLNLIALAAQRTGRRIEQQKWLSALELTEQIQQAAAMSAATLREKLDSEGIDALRILVVEDEGAQRTLISDTLRGAGFFVAEVGDGNEAIEYLYQMPRPDAIITDLTMPNCNGAELLDVAQQSPVGRGILMVSITGSEVSAELEGRLDMVMRKPIDTNLLVSELRTRLPERAAAEHSAA